MQYTSIDLFTLAQFSLDIYLYSLLPCIKHFHSSPPFLLGYVASPIWGGTAKGYCAGNRYDRVLVYAQYIHTEHTAHTHTPKTHNIANKTQQLKFQTIIVVNTMEKRALSLNGKTQKQPLH